MTSDRPYRRALGHEEAMDELISGAGGQFDPEIVDAFTHVVGTTNRGMPDPAC